MIDLMVSSDGTQRRCCICFELCQRAELEPVSDEPGMFWDVCKTCATKEKQHGAVY